MKYLIALLFAAKTFPEIAHLNVFGPINRNVQNKVSHVYRHFRESNCLSLVSTKNFSK